MVILYFNRKVLMKMTKRVLSIILVLALCFVFVGCNSGKTSSEDGKSYTYTLLANKPDDWDTNWTSYFEMDADGNPVQLKGDVAPEFVANKYLARGVVQKTQSDDVADDTESGGGGNTGKKVNAKASKSTKFASDPYSDIPAALKGTTVEYLMCRPITNNDRTLVANFEKKTGIKVKLTYAEYGGYGTTVANRVAAKNSPDIIIGERVAYPNGLISLCEPLDTETFKLEDPFWDYESMKGCKLRGKYYGLFTNNDIYHDARMMMINVPLLKQILGGEYATKSPRALWKAGKWNLEALHDLCVKIKDKGYMPLTYISQYDFALASGQDLVKFDGTRFSSNLSNKTLQKAWGWFNEFVNTNGLTENYNQNNFLAQKDVFFINTVYNCYNKESIAGWAKFEVDAVPVPGVNGVTNAPCDFRPYSIAKGAKNPVGAAYFLRYMLDYKNNFSKAEAVNANVLETAIYVSNKLPKTFEFSSSLLLYVGETAEGSVRTHLVTAEKGQMTTAFAKCENLIGNAVKRVNTAVLKVK